MNTPLSLVTSEWLERWQRLRALVAVAAIALPVTVGLTTGALTDFGRGTDLKFFELVAQIVPVFFLATVVEYFAPGRSARRTQIGTIVVLADVILAEAFALYAVGAQEATTFLTVTCAVALLSQMVDLAAVLASWQTGAPPSTESGVTLGSSSSGTTITIPFDMWLAERREVALSDEPPSELTAPESE